MRPRKAEAAAHGRHCRGDMSVRMRKVLARPSVHLLLLPLLQIQIKILPYPQEQRF